MTAPCTCSECADVHADFISNFGRWPNMTHSEGQELKERRIANEASGDPMTAMA